MDNPNGSADEIKTLIGKFLLENVKKSGLASTDIQSSLTQYGISDASKFSKDEWEEIITKLVNDGSDYRQIIKDIIKKRRGKVYKEFIRI